MIKTMIKLNINTKHTNKIKLNFKNNFNIKIKIFNISITILTNTMTTNQVYIMGRYI